jgi:2-methylcitrate dehydratase PrpD
MVSAFDIALNQAAGSRAMARDTKSIIRAIRDCFSARNGVLSALMAQRNITGGVDCLESKLGLYDLYFNGEYNPASLTDQLGKGFWVNTVSFKPWPSCRLTHAYISALLELIREYDIRPEDVKEITAVIGNNDLDLCEPLAERRKPQLGIHAKISIPFTLAIAIARRKVVIGDFMPENLQDPIILKNAGMVNYRLNTKQDTINGISQNAIVEVKIIDGKQYSKEAQFAYGHPCNPLSMTDLIAKFRGCARYSAKPLTEEKIDRAVEIIGTLEDVKDVSYILQMFG